MTFQNTTRLTQTIELDTMPELPLQQIATPLLTPAFENPQFIECRGGPEGDYLQTLADVRTRGGHIEQVITKHPGFYALKVFWSSATHSQRNP